jgi:3-phosphoshikimate 1-carboxyvinyltransferase
VTRAHQLPPLVGSTAVPGDKSCTQRALLLGAVAAGRTVADGALAALDTLATTEIVARLGASVAWSAKGTLTIEGADALASADEPLDCRNAGTAARLLLGLLAGRPGRWTLTGDASLRRRPMGRVAEPLRALGADIAAPGGRTGGETLPLVVTGRPLRGGNALVELPSAQVKSALLLAGLVADGPLTVEQHVPTRDHTERMLAAFGVRVEVEPGAATVHPGRPRGASLSIPGDPSSAAFLVAAALLRPGSEVWLRDVGLWPRRTGFLRALDRAGADVMVMRREAAGEADAARLAPRAGDAEPRGDIRATAAEPRAFDIAPEDVPDLVDELPILALVAARARGTSRFAGLGELRVKESDRVATIAALLSALGVPVQASADSLAITGVPAFSRPSRWPPLDDHRLALTAAVAAVASGWPLPDLSAAEVSFPGFAARLATLGSGSATVA